MMTHHEIAAAQQAEGDARKAAAIANYEAARKALPAAAAAAKAGDRDACWMAASRLHDAERLVQVFVDAEQFGAINARITAAIQAEQAARS